MLLDALADEIRDAGWACTERRVDTSAGPLWVVEASKNGQVMVAKATERQHAYMKLLSEISTAEDDSE